MFQRKGTNPEGKKYFKTNNIGKQSYKKSSVKILLLFVSLIKHISNPDSGLYALDKG